MKTLNKKFSKSVMAAAVLGASGLLWSGISNALPSFASGLVPGENTISDDDVELFFDLDGSGLVSTGDIFIGFVGMNTIQPSNEQPGTTINELTAAYALEVGTSVVPGGSCGGAASGCVTFDITAPSIGLATALDLAGFDYDPNTDGAQSAAVALAGLGLSANATLLAFEDATPDFVVSTATQQDLVNTIMDGTFVLELGDIGAFMEAGGPANPAEILAAPDGLAVGTFSFVLGITQTTLPLDITQPAVGGGQVFKPGAGVAFPIKTNTDITVFRSVPEPATLGLLGVGLLGLAFRRRSNIV